MTASTICRRTLAALVLTVGLGACSDEDPTAPADGLTSAEAAQLAVILTGMAVEQGFTASSSGAPAAPPSGLARTPVDIDTQVQFSAPCPLGGSIDVAASMSGTVDPELGAMDTHLAVTQTHSGCVVSGEGSGATFTLDGAPDIAVSIDLESSAQTGSFTISGSFDGGVAWATGDRSGTCTMDLVFAASGQPSTQTGSSSVTGTICGVSVDQTASLT